MYTIIPLPPSSSLSPPVCPRLAAQVPQRGNWTSLCPVHVPSCHFQYHMIFPQSLLLLYQPQSVHAPLHCLHSMPIMTCFMFEKNVNNDTHVMSYMLGWPGRLQRRVDTHHMMQFRLCQHSLMRLPYGDLCIKSSMMPGKQPYPTAII